MNAQNVGIDAVRPVAEQRLAGQLEQDPAVAEPVAASGRSAAVAGGVAHSSSPSA